MSWRQSIGLLKANVSMMIEAGKSPPARTPTPIHDLTQRSAVQINNVPLILAAGFKSLMKDIPGRHIVTEVGQLSIGYMDFYRAYLSQGDGAFIHVAVSRVHPTTILEIKLYQPYGEEMRPKYMTLAQAQDDLPGVEIDESKMVWDFWLKDDPDPDVGGMIGHPAQQGLNADGAPLYSREWESDNPARIQPISTIENIVDMEGNTRTVRHSMMNYVRQLTPDLPEYLLVSAIESDGAVDMWVGINLTINDLTVYAAA